MKEAEDIETLRTELAALRKRVAELEDSAPAPLSQLAQLAQHAPDVLSRHTPEGRIVEVSPSCRAVWGHEPAAITGASFVNLVHPDDRAALTRAFTSAAQGSEVVSLACRFHHKSDIYMWIEVLLSGVREPSGVVFVHASSRDITARRRAEREQAERFAWAEERSQMLDDLIACVPGIVWEVQGASEEEALPATFVSDQAESLLGYPIRDWLSVPDFWAKIVHPDDKDKLRVEGLGRGEAMGGNIAEYRVLAKDGREVWVETHTLPILDERGEAVGRRGVALDITARKRAEHESQKMLERAQILGKKLDSLIASIPGIVWESYGGVDPLDYMPEYVSEYVLTMTGYTVEEWRSHPDMWLKIMHPDDREGAIEEGWKVAEVGSGSLQYRIITKDGRTIWAETHERMIYDESGKPIGMRGVTLDISARKQAEEERARLSEEMIEIQAERLAELSTPLIPISDRIMVMPLIGALDRERAENVIANLLRGMGASRAEVAILDITGVPSVDNQIADALVRAAKSVQLLGAQVVLTGIRPEVAQTFVSLDVDLRGIVTQSTLQSGIAYAMSRGAAASRSRTRRRAS